MSVRISVESLSGCAWNGCPSQRGIRSIEGVFTEEQKAEAIHKVTEAMVSVEGENMRALTWVLFEEVKSGSWGIAGEAITAEKVLKLQAGE